jgi:hypothetical protein
VKIPLFLITIGLAIPIAASAHHGTSVLFDHDQRITLKGIVTEFVWRNPHVHLWLRVTEGQFKGQKYSIEMNSPGGMRRWGWTRNSIQPGDEITVQVHPSKVGRPAGECLYCTVEIKGKPTLRPSVGQ